MSSTGLLLIAIFVGYAAGVLTHWLNQRLAAGEPEAAAPELPLERVWAPWLDAGILGLLAWRFGLSAQSVVSGAVGLVLVQVLVFDARHRLILNKVIYPAIAAALLISPINPLLGGGPSLTRMLSAAEGALLAGGLFYIIVVLSRGGVGLGDAKLTFFLGAILGLLPLPTSPIIRALIYGVVLGGVAAGFLLLSRIRQMRDFIPYGPFLCVGGLLALLFPCGLLGPTSC